LEHLSKNFRKNENDFYFQKDWPKNVRNVMERLLIHVGERESELVEQKYSKLYKEFIKYKDIAKK